MIKKIKQYSNPTHPFGISLLLSPFLRFSPLNIPTLKLPPPSDIQLFLPPPPDWPTKLITKYSKTKDSPHYRAHPPSKAV